MKDSFLHSVTDELIRRFGWAGLHDVTLVFPMHRAGVVMRHELQERMSADRQRALWAPEMMALGDLFDSLCPLGKEDELFCICRLYRIYRTCLQHTAETTHSEVDIMEIDRFYSWGRQLLSDFTNIDQGIGESETDAFFRNALSLSDLDTYKLDDEVRQRLEDLLYKGEARQQSLIAQSVQAHFAALWQALPDIYHQLRDELLQAGKGYDGQRMRYVVSHWSELSTRAQSKMYCFIGFNYLLPVERQLMQLLHAEGRALFFWDYVEDFHTNSKAFAFIRQNMLTLPNALPAMHWGAPRTIRAISATSVHSEAEYAGQWLKQTYQTKGEPTAIVICDETQIEPVIYGLPPIRLEGCDTTEEINITKGYPLRNTQVFADVAKALGKSLHHKADNPMQAIQVVVDFVDEQSKLSAAAQQNTWQWHLGREALYQTRKALIRFIHILNDGLVCEILGHPDMLRRLIMRHLEQITLPFHGEPVTDLQIMGVLETRTLDFKHLLLLNVEEGIIPAHQPDKSFLPYYLRKAYGLQTHDERASVYAYNFFRMLNRANDVTLLFSQSQTAMTKKSMSRFVMQMMVSDREFNVERFVLTESNTIRPAQTMEVLADAEWKTMTLQAGKQLRLSPSAINTFYTCKRMFYLEYMLGLREEDEQETIFSNRTLGLFVHEAMHYLYAHYCHCVNWSPTTIHPNQVEQLNTPERRDEALHVAYDVLNDAYLKNHEGATPIYDYSQHTMENHVIDTYIQHLLERDRYDAEQRGLTILLLEEPIYATIGQVSVGGRLDRLDQIGSLHGLPPITRIVDYKCGKYNDKKMNAAEADLRTPEKEDIDYVRQTLLYSFVTYDKVHNNMPPATTRLSADRIEPHLFFAAQDLTNTNTRTCVSVNKLPISYDHNQHQHVTTLIHDMINDVLNERNFPMCAECSPYCPFLLLCGRTPTKR